MVRALPEDVFQQFDRNLSNIVNLRVKAWSSKTYYIQKVLPRLLESGYPIKPIVKVNLISNRMTVPIQLFLDEGLYVLRHSQVG